MSTEKQLNATTDIPVGTAVRTESTYRKHLNAICMLWTDPNTGNISHSKFWNNIACATATVIVAKMGADIKLEFFQWYLGLVGFQALASKFITLKLKGFSSFKEASEEQSKK
jgi:hypothetical protein